MSTYLVQNFTIAFVESIRVPSISKRMPENVPSVVFGTAFSSGMRASSRWESGVVSWIVIFEFGTEICEARKGLFLAGLLSGRLPFFSLQDGCFYEGKTGRLFSQLQRSFLIRFAARKTAEFLRSF